MFLPLTRGNPEKYRVKLWSDNREALRNIVLKTAHLPQNLLAPHNFVGKSDSPDLVKVYLSVLLKGDIHPQRNELMCQIAVLGLRQYLKGCANPSADIESSLAKMKDMAPDLHKDIMDN